MTSSSFTANEKYGMGLCLKPNFSKWNLQLKNFKLLNLYLKISWSNHFNFRFILISVMVENSNDLCRCISSAQSVQNRCYNRFKSQFYEKKKKEYNVIGTQKWKGENENTRMGSLPRIVAEKYDISVSWDRTQ